MLGIGQPIPVLARFRLRKSTVNLHPSVLLTDFAWDTDVGEVLLGSVSVVYSGNDKVSLAIVFSLGSSDHLGG